MGLHDEYRICVCDDEDILQKYVHGDLHNDNKSISKDNLGNVRMVWDVYNVDVVSMRLGKDNIGKDEIRDIEDNINNFKMIWDVYNDDVDVVSMCGKDGIKVDNIEDNLGNVMGWDVCNDNVGVVSVCGKDEFRVDDIKKDGYLVINDSVIKDVANSKDDYNDNVSITNIEVVIEEDNVVVKWMVITYKEERKEMIMRTTHAKEGKDPSRWWDVQLNRGGYIANNSVSHLKENDWLIRRSTWFLHSVRQDTSTS